jgi:hypothetical protein
VAELPQQSYPAGKVTLDLNVSNLASGMYILNWQSDAGNAAMRFVVE